MVKLEQKPEQKSAPWKEVGLRLKTAREHSGLTQDQVAVAMDVTVQAVWVWEAGRSMPRADRLQNLAKYYGVSTEWLLGIEAEKDSATDDIDIYQEVNLFLRSPGLTPEAIQDIKDYLRFKREQARRHADNESS